MSFKTNKIYSGPGGSGSGGGGSFTDTRDFNASVTGPNFNLSNAPNFIYGVYKNGQLLSSEDYAIGGSLITFTDVLDDDSITVIYNY